MLQTLGGFRGGTAPLRGALDPSRLLPGVLCFLPSGARRRRCPRNRGGLCLRPQVGSGLHAVGYGAGAPGSQQAPGLSPPQGRPAFLRPTQRSPWALQAARPQGSSSLRASESVRKIGDPRSGQGAKDNTARQTPGSNTFRTPRCPVTRHRVQRILFVDIREVGPAASGCLKDNLCTHLKVGSSGQFCSC